MAVIESCILQAKVQDIFWNYSWLADSYAVSDFA